MTRDHDLEDWVFTEEGSRSDITVGREFGCGYPGDSKTKKWLLDHFDPCFGFPRIVRWVSQYFKGLFQKAQTYIK